jgi:hypothetical protein
MIRTVVRGSNTKTRLFLWTGLLVIEAILVARFFVIPQLHHSPYDTHTALWLEIDMVVIAHPLLDAAAIAFLGLFVVANVALMIVIWRAFTDVQARD